MLSENDRQNLLRNLSRNRVTLVTGAGFSRGATNSLGEPLPLAADLAKLLWAFLYDEPYDDKTSLKTIYGAALRHKRGIPALREFMSEHLSVSGFPTWYQLIPRWFWYRIYSFNPDDLMELIYKDQQPSLDTIVAPDRFKERDQFLRQIQYVKLHGSIHSDKDFTFSPKEYASRAAERADIWYIHFVEDYATLPTLFVGTELDEPIFWQYVEMRGGQAIRGDKVRRPKCFLVSPTISKPNEEMLGQYNIVPVRATAEEFFQWLAAQEPLQTREDTIRQIFEGLEPAVFASERGAALRDVKRIEYFYSIFRVPFRAASPKRGGFFLLGAPATWDDIANDVDAHREVSEVLMQHLEECFRDDRCDISLVDSSAGGGKSTVCRRAAMELVDLGYSVYFSDGTSRPDPELIAEHILTLRSKVFLFFDNAGDDLVLIADLWASVRQHEFKPVFVVAARSNDIAYKGHELRRNGARLHDITIPNLTRNEIVGILETLERHDFLGVLKDKSQQERIELFEKKAKSQILVAMREVTTGRGFDDILKDEYVSLESDDVRLLYIIAAIASDDDYGLTMQQMITALDLPPNETMILVEKNLNGILLQHENDPNLYFIRHPAIAYFIVQNAPKTLLAAALTTLMICLTTVLPEGRARRTSRAFRLYRRILSHTRMQTLFLNRSSLARSVYEGIRDYCRDDGHYWLHYASFEIEQGGDISVAENYLAQAEGLLSNSKQVETAMAHLLFVKAMSAGSAPVAAELSSEACTILRSHMLDSRTVSLHALHIFGSQMIAYIWKWIPTTERAGEFQRIHRELERSIPDNMKPSPILKQVLADLKRAELETTVTRR